MVQCVDFSVLYESITAKIWTSKLWIPLINIAIYDLLHRYLSKLSYIDIQQLEQISSVGYLCFLFVFLGRLISMDIICSRPSQSGDEGWILETTHSLPHFSAFSINLKRIQTPHIYSRISEQIILCLGGRVQV